MSVIDEVLGANREYANTFRLGNLPMPPSRKLAIVALNLEFGVAPGAIKVTTTFPARSM